MSCLSVYFAPPPFFFLFTANKQKDGRANIPPPQRNNAGKQEIKQPPPQPTIGSPPIVLPLNVAGNAVNTAAPNLAPQPVIVNNQVLLDSFFKWHARRTTFLYILI